MKTLDKIVVIAFVVCLLLCSIIVPINIIATSESYYVNQFEKCNIFPDENSTKTIYHIGGTNLSKTALTKSQILEIVEHITQYLSYEKESFELDMDKINVDGKVMDNVSIFGGQAVAHMEDVRHLFKLLQIISYVAVVVIVAGCVYMFVRRKSIKNVIFSYSLYAVLGIFAILLLIFAVIVIRYFANGGAASSVGFFDSLWTDMHHIFFPLSREKFGGSFFDDTLTELLTVDFFMNTVVIILVNVVAVLTAWLVSARVIKVKSSK